MAHLPISVIVVSRHRPEFLKRCLTAIGQLDHPRFETIVVACPAGAEVARAMGLAKVCPFDATNISVARNLGVTQAAGEVVAFIDDDAVPEPTWLWHLGRGFEDRRVAQAGGVTLGRNGISVQHGAARVDPMGQTHPVSLSGDEPFAVEAEGDRVPRVHGTNMAIRRAVLANLGGFDPRFAFYLDETDLSVRIARAGGHTVFVPGAVVHHASGASAFRDAERVPKRVDVIAASAAVFHRKHCMENMRAEAKARFLAERRAWLLKHMSGGALTPDKALKFIRELERGYEAGLELDAEQVDPLPTTGARLSEMPQPVRKDLCLLRNRDTGDAVLERARDLVRSGNRVTVFDLRPDGRFHHVRFTADGYWLHRGGIFGRELRDEPLLRRSTREARVQATLKRLSNIRSKNQIERA
jgi:GT2 family glycosyltransferase